MRGKAAAFHQIVPVAVGPKWGFPPPLDPRLALPLVCGCVLRSPAAPRCAGVCPARPLSAAPLRRGSLSPAELRPQTGAAPRRGRHVLRCGRGLRRSAGSLFGRPCRPAPPPCSGSSCPLRALSLSLRVASRRNARARAWACLWLRPGGPLACSGSGSPCSFHPLRGCSAALAPARPLLPCGPALLPLRGSPRLGGCAAAPLAGLGPPPGGRLGARPPGRAF